MFPHISEARRLTIVRRVALLATIAICVRWFVWKWTQGVGFMESTTLEAIDAELLVTMMPWSISFGANLLLSVGILVLCLFALTSKPLWYENTRMNWKYGLHEGAIASLTGGVFCTLMSLLYWMVATNEPSGIEAMVFYFLVVSGLGTGILCLVNPEQVIYDDVRMRDLVRMTIITTVVVWVGTVFFMPATMALAMGAIVGGLTFMGTQMVLIAVAVGRWSRENVLLPSTEYTIDMSSFLFRGFIRWITAAGVNGNHATDP